MLPWLVASAAAVVGDAVEHHEVDLHGPSVRGLAADDRTGALLALDGRDGGAVHVLRGTPLQVAKTHALPQPLTAPRGLAARREQEHPVAWVLDWTDGVAQLWRQDLEAGTASSVAGARLGIETEPTGLTWHGDALWVSVTPTSTDDGLLRIELPQGGWQALLDGSEPQVRSLPGAGLRSSDSWHAYRGLTTITVESEAYLFGVLSNQAVALDARTGRALFAVDVPRTLEGNGPPHWGVASAEGELWVTEPSSAGIGLHQLDVVTDLDTPATSPWMLRHLQLQVTTAPKPGAPRRAGAVMHTYGHPVPLPNQQAVADSRVATDLGRPPQAEHIHETWFPAADRSTPVEEDRFGWREGQPRTRVSEVQVDARVRSARWSIYPHRASLQGAPEGYTADSVLYGLEESRTYEAFLARVRAWLTRRYGLTEAEAALELQHAYWAARDITEYIVAHYWYPDGEAGFAATQDHSRNHFAGSPAPPKLALSTRSSSEAIVACNGGNVMLDGVLRYLGHPARWLGSTHASSKDARDRDDPEARWDRDGDRFLDPEERQVGVNGHRWTQAWLGPHYGWQTFDATPEARAPGGDMGEVPAPSQYKLLRELGHLPGDRVVLTVGSGAHEPLFRTYPPPVTGGDQDFNLMGKYSHPQHWRYPSHEITWSTPLAITDVRLQHDGDQATVSWSTAGPWHHLESAAVDVIIERWKGDGRNGRPRRMATAVPIETGSVTLTLPAPPEGFAFRAVVHQYGDPLVGGRSDVP